MTDLKPDAMDQDDVVMDDISEDMSVVDSQGNKVGSVDFVRFGEGHDVASVSSADNTDDFNTVVDIAIDAFSQQSDMPEELRAKLKRHGFARVSGLLPNDTYYFIPEQVTRIEDDTVYLNTTKDNLVSG